VVLAEHSHLNPPKRHLSLTTLKQERVFLKFALNLGPPPQLRHYNLSKREGALQGSANGLPNRIEKWCQRSTPTVAAENSVRVLPWHSIRLASESHSKPHPRHSLSELPQPISAAVVEH